MKFTKGKLNKIYNLLNENKSVKHYKKKKTFRRKKGMHGKTVKKTIQKYDFRGGTGWNVFKKSQDTTTNNNKENGVGTFFNFGKTNRQRETNNDTKKEVGSVFNLFDKFKRTKNITSDRDREVVEKPPLEDMNTEVVENTDSEELKEPITEAVQDTDKEAVKAPNTKVLQDTDSEELIAPITEAVQDTDKEAVKAPNTKVLQDTDREVVQDIDREALKAPTTQAVEKQPEDTNTEALKAPTTQAVQNTDTDNLLTSTERNILTNQDKTLENTNELFTEEPLSRQTILGEQSTNTITKLPSIEDSINNVSDNDLFISPKIRNMGEGHPPSNPYVQDELLTNDMKQYTSTNSSELSESKQKPEHIETPPLLTNINVNELQTEDSNALLVALKTIADYVNNKNIQIVIKEKQPFNSLDYNDKSISNRFVNATDTLLNATDATPITK
jgi:hypothetical protein